MTQVNANNVSIKIPERQYVGFSQRGTEEMLLGFMTPDGTDSAAIKRKATVDSWALPYRTFDPVTKQHVQADPIPSVSMENVPVSGFRFTKTVKHGYGWGKGDVKWRVEDPRGFELEITSANLSQIMEVATIERGMIMDDCLWGRLGAINILIPITSDVYKIAFNNTVRANKSASVKDLKPGYRVVLQNGTEGRYLGYYYEYSLINGVEPKLESNNKKHCIRLENGSIHCMSSLKLSSIDETPGELSKEEAETIINTKSLLPKDYYYGYRGYIYSSKKIETSKPELIPCSLAELKSTVNRYDYHTTFIAKVGDKYGTSSARYLSDDYYGSDRPINVTIFDIDAFAEGKIKTTKIRNPRYNPGYHYNSYGSEFLDETLTFSQTAPDVEFFKIKTTVTLGNGVEITI